MQLTRRSQSALRLLGCACGVSGLLVALPTSAAEASAEAATEAPASGAAAGSGSGKERQLTPEEIDAWLDSRAMPNSRGDHASDADADAPPPLPRKKGFVLESSIGVLGEVGRLKHITPNAPWFALRFGFEPLEWLMVFVDGDLAVLTTSYANPPPPPRSLAFWSIGCGIRFTVRPTDRFGMYLQGSIGAGRVTEDVLKLYGYQHADELSYYQGAEIGFEWYQVNPHLALTLHGGIRNYPRVLKRDLDTQPTMAWVGGAGLRYTF